MTVYLDELEASSCDSGKPWAVYIATAGCRLLYRSPPGVALFICVQIDPDGDLVPRLFPLVSSTHRPTEVHWSPVWDNAMFAFINAIPSLRAELHQLIMAYGQPIPDWAM